MKVLILGSDGYIGYPLTLHLLKQGYRVMGIDNYTRRQRVFSVGGSSLTPILGPQMRKAYLTNQFPNYAGCVSMNLNEFDRLQAILNTYSSPSRTTICSMVYEKYDSCTCYTRRECP